MEYKKVLKEWLMLGLIPPMNTGRQDTSTAFCFNFVFKYSYYVFPSKLT